jgi:CTP synthase (UTP-ammonia lyase)
LLQRIYGCEEVVEEFFCNYEVNPQYEPDLASAGLAVVARAEHGEARAVELAGHPFFVATLFQPQLSSTAEKPHPLITAFVKAAVEFSRARQAPPQTARA